MNVNKFSLLSQKLLLLFGFYNSQHTYPTTLYSNLRSFFPSSSHSYHTIREIERARLWAWHGSEMWIGLDHCATLKWNNFYISRFHLSLPWPPRHVQTRQFLLGQKRKIALNSSQGRWWWRWWFSTDEREWEFPSYSVDHNRGSNNGQPNDLINKLNSQCGNNL